LPGYLILWLFALPIWDICSVVYSRRKRGVSPVIAGRDHIHHILMGLGLNVRRTVHLIYLLTLLGIALGLALAFVGASLVESTVMFIAATVLYVGRMNRFYREVCAKMTATMPVVELKTGS
jgi:UDP-GlcNAc:undecaprenyl-phosphate GlcNAc-1-phosphate transferase